MDGTGRKGLRLAGFDYGSVGYYFVTVCTRKRMCTLGCVVRADVLIGSYIRLTALGRLVDETIARMPNVDRYVIMPNHVHLILKIEPSDGGPMGTSARTIPKLVHFLKAAVSKSWGSSVWHRSYHDHIIRNESDYLRIYEYMDTNPARWAEDCYYEEE